MATETDVPPLRVTALTRGARAAVIALRALAIANVLYLQWHLLGDVLEGTQSAPPRAVAIGLALLSGLPWLVTLGIERAGRGTLAVEPSQVVLELGRTRFEIPIAKVREIRGSAAPWTPHALTLVLASGRPFERALAGDDPRALLAALVKGIPDAKVAAPAAALAFWAEVRARTGRPRWMVPVKLGLAPLALAIIAFRLQQIIMFGGPLGLYHQRGIGPYALAFADAWVTSIGDLIAYAAAVRFAVEPLAAAATWLAVRGGTGGTEASTPAPGARAARRIRLGAEAAVFVAYFVVIPGFLALRISG